MSEPGIQHSCSASKLLEVDSFLIEQRGAEAYEQIVFECSKDISRTIVLILTVGECPPLCVVKEGRSGAGS